jgi:uncharacterized protein YceK
MKKTAALALALIGLSACGTIGDIARTRDVAFDSPGPHVYGGVRLDAVLGAEPWGREAPLGIFHWLDIPLSLVFDTILFPVTVTYSFFPEGRDYITVERSGLDKAIAEEKALSYRSSLLYVGSEGGFHHLRFSRFNYAVTRYRIKESELRIERPFAYTRDSAKFLVVMDRDDPWPLPEPLKSRRH